MSAVEALAAITAVLDDNDRALHARQLDAMLEAVFGGPERVEPAKPKLGVPVPPPIPCRLELVEAADEECVRYWRSDCECADLPAKLGVEGLDGSFHNAPRGTYDRDRFQIRHGFRYEHPWTVDEEPDYAPFADRPGKLGTPWDPAAGTCDNPACCPPSEPDYRTRIRDRLTEVVADRGLGIPVHVDEAARAARGARRQATAWSRFMAGNRATFIVLDEERTQARLYGPGELPDSSWPPSELRAPTTELHVIETAIPPADWGAWQAAWQAANPAATEPE